MLTNPNKQMDRAKVLVVKNMMFFFIICLFTWSMKLSKAQMVPSLFIIGDSQVDVGNNNHLPFTMAKANFPQNGIDFPNRKATGRFSNGKNTADFLAEKLGLPSPRPYFELSNQTGASYMTGVNFASGGAGILDSTDKVLGQSMPLSFQVDKFLEVHNAMSQKMGSGLAERHFSKSLVAVIIGSNDIFDYFRHNEKKNKDINEFFSRITPRQLVASITKKLKLQIKKLYESGARKFVVTGAGTLGCIPAQRAKNITHGCNESMNFCAAKFNKAVRAVLEGLKSELQDLNFSFLNLYGLVESVTLNPSAYGFKEVRAACCGIGLLRTTLPCLPFSLVCPDRSDHIYWDLFHPTEAMSRLVADTIFDGPPEYCVPMNVRKLVSV